MVFTRKRQAEDDAAQIDVIDAACSAAVSSGTAPSAPLTEDATATSKKQIRKISAVKHQGTLNGKWPVRKQKKVKLADRDDEHAGNINGQLPKQKQKQPQVKIESDEEEHASKNAPFTKAEPGPATKGRRSNKMVPINQNTGEDEEYSPAIASTISDQRQQPIRFLRRRGQGAIVRTVGVITLKVAPRRLAGLSRRMHMRKLAGERQLQKKALAAEGIEAPTTNKWNFTFGVSKLEYHNAPRPSDIELVAEILGRERPSLLAQASQDSAATPMHSGKQFTIDAIVRVILSQSSTNEGALDAQQCMLHAYPYIVNGQKVVGTIPNYHLMRIQSQSKLDKALKRGGLNAIKAKAIKDFLDKIHNINLSSLMAGEVTYRYNAPNAPDFVPGLLSVDYLRTIYITKGKQALFDHLVGFSLIGVKSASCIMAFGMELPVFAVDTHVAGMAKLLGWVPQDAKEDDMCSHLDAKINDDIKFDLHQDFWRHRRACARCGRSSPGSWAYENSTCPLELLITRPKPKEVATGKEKSVGNAKDSSEVEVSNIRTSGKAKASNRAKVPTKKQPRPPVIKKVDENVLKARENALIAQGKIKVTYRVDDDFDAASNVFTIRSVWIEDYSMVEADVQLVPEDEGPVEELEIPRKRDVASLKCVEI
ncbi:hypothetical protein LTR84_006245 [Exophiala bonariae]|uniref:HhH-GPD domain-containing protein n=1 Tax=Exophiala bonariae TaxID=1690606 RepID=A0AAV9N4T2_9EURO|nr:hypothetical protein LTR84_006245 [Exophiala bonariae]